MIPKICSIHCGRQHSETCPWIGSLSHLKGFQIRVGCHGPLQRRLCVMHIADPDLPASLPQEQGMIPCIKLFNAPKICKQVYCDDTGGRPVIQGRQSRLGDLQPCLIDWQAGDSMRWDLGRIPQGKGREERVLQGLFDWEKIIPDAWGEAMDKITLLLEGIFKTSICCLRMLFCHPSQKFNQVRPTLYLLVHTFLI